jgi:tRNA threonylcarbamoyladenosine biosynthesis protein TsaE
LAQAAGQPAEAVITTSSPEETRAVGRLLADLVQPGDLILLDGPFGSGKTTLVQGLAEGLGVRGPVPSPSFTLIQEYRPGAGGPRLPLYHLDLYRLRSPEEALGLGLEEYLAGDGVVVIEWPEPARPLLPAERLEIRVQYRDDGREIRLRAVGARYVLLLTRFVERWYGQPAPLARH